MSLTERFHFILICAAHLGRPLEDFVSSKTKLKLLRSGYHAGLIHARLSGAEVATGDVIMFLDSHCEVTKGNKTKSPEIRPHSVLRPAVLISIKSTRTNDTNVLTPILRSVLNYGQTAAVRMVTIIQALNNNNNNNYHHHHHYRHHRHIQNVYNLCGDY